MKRYLVQLLILSVVMVVVAACGQATTPAYPAATQAVANAPVPTAKATPTKSAAVQPTATTVAASPSVTAGAQSDKVWTLSQLKDKKQLPQSSDWPNCKPGGYFGIGPECIVEPKTGPQLTGGCPPQGVGDESEQITRPFPFPS
jgi:hypothetical protein